MLGLGQQGLPLVMLTKMDVLPSNLLAAVLSFVLAAAHAALLWFARGLGWVDPVFICFAQRKLGVQCFCLP